MRCILNFLKFPGKYISADNYKAGQPGEVSKQAKQARQAGQAGI